jgi:predicted DNA-binding protein
MKERKGILSVRLDPGMIARVRALAAAEGCTPSAWIRRAIEAAIRAAEPKQLGITEAELLSQAAALGESADEFRRMVGGFLRDGYHGLERSRHVQPGHPRPPCYRLDNGGPWVHVQPSCRCKDGS